MKIIKPQTLGLLTRPYEFQRRFHLGVSVLAFLPIGDVPVLLKEAEMWPFLAEELPPDQTVDAALPKPRPEFLAVAHCYAPEGRPAPLVATGIQLGPLIKRLNVHGDRDRDARDASLSPAVPFIQMTMDWTRAYGGPGFADNPLGRGTVPVEGSDSRIFAMQNIVNPKLGAEGTRLPAGYGPIDQMWPARAKRAGTYDGAWLQQDFPGFPRDIDWHFFNVAPEDQWLPEPLAGDETYAFQNLHPQLPLLRGRLPGLAPRLFLVRKTQGDGGGFEEVTLTLTTVWFFPHRERLVLVHHGRARLAEEDASDIARVVVGADRLGALRPAEAFRDVMVKRADTKGGAIHALRDADLVPAEWLAPAEAASPEPSAPQLAVARARRRAERERDAVLATIKARGLDPAVHGPPPLPPETPIPTLEELPAFVEAARAQADALKAKALADLEVKKAEIAAQLAANGLSQAEIDKRLNAKAKGPPGFSAAAVRAEMAGTLAAMRLFGQLTYEAEAKLASPELAANLAKAEAAVRDGYRLTAHTQDPAKPLSAARNAEIRRLVAADPPAARVLYDLHGADLSGLDLSGLDLSGVCLDGANLTGTSFAGANLRNAVLAHARMRHCVLDGADLSGASLGRADLTRASLRRAVLKKSVLAGANLTRACFAGADLERADLSEVVIDGTDFSAVHAPGLLAMKLSLRGLQAPGIVLTKAKFLECDLGDVDFNGANLEKAVFLQCDLTGAQLRDARLCKAVFVQKSCLANADLSEADLTGANLRETDLRGAILEQAIIADADLSGAELGGAVLTQVRGAACRMVAADLRNADLRHADFAEADLSRADLRGADLTGLSVYQANFPRVKLDRETRRGGMLRTRMRYLPIHEPAGQDGS